MKYFVLGIFLFASMTVVAQNNNFNRNPIAFVMDGDIRQTQIRIEKILTEKLELIETANTHQNLKCGTVGSHGVSVYAFKSRCQNSLTRKKVATVYVDLIGENLEFEIKTARNQTLILPADLER